jgi:hypothetical protein
MGKAHHSTHDKTSYSSNTHTDYTVKTYVNDTEHKIRRNSRDRLCKSQWPITRAFHTDANNRQDTTQLLDEVFVISRMIKVEISVISRAEGEIDNTCLDLDCSGYHNNRIQ